MTNITLKKAQKADYKEIKRLFKSAFPAKERPPFFIMKAKANQGKGEMLVARDNDTFIGFAYLVCYRDMAYLFFLAIDDSKRGMGYGSKILQKLKQKYNKKRLFLAREQLDKSSENYDERVKRHNFYLKNGFTDLPYKLKEANVTYDVMSNATMITPNEYDALISRWTGKLIGRFIDMRIIE